MQCNFPVLVYGLIQSLKHEEEKKEIRHCCLNVRWSWFVYRSPSLVSALFHLHEFPVCSSVTHFWWTKMAKKCIGISYSSSSLVVIPLPPWRGQYFCWALLFIHHRDFLRDLLLWVRVIWQLVQVLHVIEALSNTLGCQTGLRVVVPALLYGGAHHLDAL